MLHETTQREAALPDSGNMSLRQQCGERTSDRDIAKVLKIGVPAELQCFWLEVALSISVELGSKIKFE